MAERNKNYFNELPNEMILKILENMKGLTERSKMAQVSYRFNILTNVLPPRKNIFISEKEFQRFSTDRGTMASCVDSILKEISHSEHVGTLIVEIPKSIESDEPYLLGCKPYNSSTLFKEIDKNISRLSNFVGSCMFLSSDNLTHYMFLLSPKCKNVDYGRTLRYHPTNPTSLNFKGKDSLMLEKILNKCKETLLEFKFEGEITLSLLRQLVKCKKLHYIILNGQFNLSSDVSETELPKIRSEVVYLNDFPASEVSMETSYMIRDIFFSDALHSLEISFYLLRGVESEICSKCPNLRSLSIDRNVYHLPDETFAGLCDNLLMHVNNHLLIYELRFWSFLSPLENILKDSVNRNLTVDYILSPSYHSIVSFSRERDWKVPSMVLRPWRGCRNYIKPLYDFSF